MIIHNGRELVQLIADFVATVNSMRLYPHNHPHVISLLDGLYESIIKHLEETQELTFFLLGNDIIAFNKPLTNIGLAGESFIKILSDNKIERLTLFAGLPKLQLYEFIRDLASGDKQSISATSHIGLGKLLYDEFKTNDDVHTDEPINLLIFNKEVSRELKNIYQEIQGKQMQNTDKVKNIVTNFIKIYDKSINPLKVLADIKSNDDYTFVHTTNVALLTISFASYLGFKEKILEDIGVAALLHDVGKMFIPEYILNKPGILSAQERAVMETHTLKGAQYIGYQDNIPKITMIAALEHHLNYDGSGYPKTRNKWRPIIVSQMISIADVYDAMRSTRPYKEAVPHSIAKAALQAGMGSTHDPTLVENFFKMIEH